MIPSLVKRRIEVSFRLGTGSYGDTGSNTVTLNGQLRASASIQHTGGVGMSQLDLSVYGMTQDLMNQLSTLGRPIYTTTNRNTVTVSAGDDVGGMAVAFTGNVLQAWADGAGAPKIAFRVTAQAGGFDQARPLQPTSFKGSADVATLVSSIATQLGRNLQNSGVTAQISNPYYTGSGRDQILAICRDANCECVFEGETGAGEQASATGGATVAIWPKGASRVGTATVVSPDTGLVGYPSWTANGIVLTTLYNPTITYGAPLSVQSSIQNACGTWTVYKVGHELESETPDGKWFTHLECALFGHELPVS